VTANYFSVVGVQPKLGRAFLPAEEEAPVPVVILSHGLWIRPEEEPGAPAEAADEPELSHNKASGAVSSRY